MGSEIDLQLRSAIESDAAAVSSVVSDAFVVYRPRMGCDPAPMSADYPALIRAGQVRVAVTIPEDGSAQILGVLVLVPAADHLYLDTLAVRPGAQGSGVGRRLLALAEAEAVRHSLPAVVLCTNEAMTENLAYYPRRGYRLTHRITEDGFRRVYFRKDLPG
jgi:ribosomal protein S18 acetylase RimI-like enzyme